LQYRARQDLLYNNVFYLIIKPAKKPGGLSFIVSGSGLLLNQIAQDLLAIVDLPELNEVESVNLI